MVSNFQKTYRGTDDLHVIVVLYTAVGGLKATFLTDILHTTIALILIIWFTISILTHKEIGGIYGLYDKIRADDSINVVGNYAGSLLSFKSKGAIMFGLLLKFGNLALVVMDTAFWQKSFASQVNSTVPGYDLASLAIFAVPWGLGTVIGLSARIVEPLAIFPTYPNALTSAEIGAGFVMPYTIKALLGTGGAVAMLLLLFMAVTSTVSSSMIAVSSIISFDFYRTYLNPKATDRQVLRVSHLGVVVHGFFIAGFALMLNYGGADGNWVLYASPILTCPGIFPLILTLFWDRQSRTAAIVSPILGLVTGIAIWFGTAYSLYGAVTFTTTGEQASALYGALGSLFSPILYTVIISLVKREKFDWNEFLKIDLVGDKTPNSAGSASPQTPSIDVGDEEKKHATSSVWATAPPSELAHIRTLDEHPPVHPFDEATLKHLHRWLRISVVFLIANVLITFVLWPMPLYRDYIFSRNFFAGWVVVAIIWQFFAVGAVVVYPIYDGRKDLALSIRGIAGSLQSLLHK